MMIKSQKATIFTVLLRVWEFSNSSHVRRKGERGILRGCTSRLQAEKNGSD